MNFISSNPTKELEKLLKSFKEKKIFIITGKKSYFKSGANTILKKNINKINTFFYFKKNYLPTLEELKKIIYEINKFKPDLIIAIGGGAVLDYAKSANVIDSIGNIKERIINSSVKIKKKCKLLAIPTTAGSGAEVTSGAVIYVGKNKYSIEDKLLKPDYFFLIPQLVLNCNKIIKASSGFDAIAQAIESLISKKSNLTSVKYSEKSLKLSLMYYLSYLKNPTKENAFKMSLAANLSGKAINISKTTAPHAVSYPFSYYYGLPHGHAVSLTLTKFLKFNYEKKSFSEANFNLNSRFNKIFAISKVKSINELNIFLSQIRKDANLTSNFDDLGIDINKHYSKIISGVSSQRLMNNPVKIEKSDLKEIILSET